MIRVLRLKNFRNFENAEFHFDKGNNLVVGENGKGKTNILEAISLLLGDEMISIEFENMVKRGNSVFFIEAELSNGEKISLSFDLENKKKNYFLSAKKITQKKVLETSPKFCAFHPLSMNIMYLSPSLRRDFLDAPLLQISSTYHQTLKSYKHIVRNRNKMLESISLLKSKKEDINFWNTQFISSAETIYLLRKNYIDLISLHTDTLKGYLNGKIQNITFEYATKIDWNDIGGSIKSYLEKNFERDLILQSTHIGPHVDDFDIKLDGISLTSFASRGETKSIILGLKLLEAKYIEEKTGKKPIILIDDIMSEIDSQHRALISDHFSDNQIIMTSIENLVFDNTIILK